MQGGGPNTHLSEYVFRVVDASGQEVMAVEASMVPSGETLPLRLLTVPSAVTAAARNATRLGWSLTVATRSGHVLGTLPLSAVLTDEASYKRISTWH